MKETIYVQVQQNIKHADSKHQESFFHRCQANKYVLNTYTKIVYADNQNEKVRLKWFSDALTQLQLRKGNQHFTFDLNKTTPLFYSTDQGVMTFEVVTKKLVISPTRVEVNYELLFDNKSLGSYEFRLIYQP